MNQKLEMLLHGIMIAFQDIGEWVLEFEFEQAAQLNKFDTIWCLRVK